MPCPAHFQDFPFCITSAATQVGAAALFVSVLLVAAQLVRLAVNSMPTLRLPPVRLRPSCGQRRYAVSPFCAPVTLRNSHSSRLPCVVNIVDDIDHL